MPDNSAYSHEASTTDAVKNSDRSDETDLFVEGEWRIETLKSLADIRNNAGRWIELEAQSNDPHAAFQGYAWCEAWAEVYCKPQFGKCEPRVFFISRGETLVAILPMMVERHMGARVLTLFGEPHSQLANVLTHGEIDVRDGLKLCIEEAALLARADVMALGPIPAKSPLFDVVDRQHLSEDPADYISLCDWPVDQTVEAHLLSLSKNNRKHFNRKRRQVEALGQLRFERLTPLDDQFKPLVLLALEWKLQWLERKAAFSLGLTRPGFKKFISAFSGREASFQPDLDVLFLDEKPISISLNITGLGIRHCYMGAYEHSLSEFSPGTLATHYSINRSIENGKSGYSFLGFPTQFKAIWSNHNIPLYRYQRALNFKGRLWLQLWTRGLRPFAKKVLIRARSVAQWPIVGKVLNGVLNLLSKQGKNG